MAKYNGFRNWTQWNVSLWINNDEPLYREALSWIRVTNTRKSAAYGLLMSLRSAGITETPDGAKYSVTAIQSAMVGM